MKRQNDVWHQSFLPAKPMPKPAPRTRDDYAARNRAMREISQKLDLVFIPLTAEGVPANG